VSACQGQPANASRRTIPAACRTRSGDVTVCTLRVTRCKDSIVLDPHITDGCVIALDQGGATTLFELLGEDIGQDAPAGNTHRTIPTTCKTHRGCTGFCNLRVTRIEEGIELDPHVTGACVIALGQTAVTALFDLLGQWLG
jgi:hypothetical protein